MAPNILEYTSCRQFIKDYYEHRKSQTKSFSYQSSDPALPQQIDHISARCHHCQHFLASRSVSS